MADFDSREDRRDVRRARREELRRRWEESGQNGRIWTGVFLLAIGGAALLRSFGVDMPVWLFTWQCLLIVLGLFIGVRHNFRGGAWFILMLVGGAFLLNDFYLNGDLRKHVWPIVIIVAGLFFIFRPKRNIQEQRKKWKDEWEQNISETPPSKEDFIDATSIFGSTKKNILSKHFVGGDITNIFGGTELNLTQADLQGQAVIDITTIFGGAEIFVPSHWMVKSEIVTIFGGVEDKRSVSTVADIPDKVLVLKGTVIFGGIEIKNFKK
ncbi:MAG: LiaF-related protein [Chitinophagaceae bacterium]